jgi:hypothetical protein
LAKFAAVALEFAERFPKKSERYFDLAKRAEGATGKSLTNRLEGVSDDVLRANSPRPNQIQEPIASLRE